MAVTLYTTKGEPFTVDDEDAPFVERFEWRKSTGCKNGPKGCVLGIPKMFAGGKYRMLRLYALIMGHPPSQGLYAVCLNGNHLCLEKSNGRV